MKQVKQAISKERWAQAQRAEKPHHVHDSVETSYEHYKIGYGKYFEYLDISTDLEGKSIIEVGPARIAGLLFCTNYSKSYIVEPIIFEETNYLYQNNNIEFIRTSLEESTLPQVDEIWLLNVLQHVQNPDLFIEKCKEVASTIKFFEPINTPTDDAHPYTFSLDDYKLYFGDCVQYYGGRSDFHEAECAYGVYDTGRIKSLSNRTRKK